MKLSEYFPVWNRLTPKQQSELERAAVLRSVPQGTLLHNGSADCLGLIVVQSGQLRAFICSDEGRELTIYRLLERDICLFSASCIMQSIQFDVTVEAEKDSSFWLIPSDLYKRLMEESAPVANYTSQIMAARFSEVMWLIEQILWKSQDRRLAAFLLQESDLEESDLLKITHEKIAAHLGTAREVITRILRYFQSEGLVVLSRGTIRLANRRALEELAGREPA